MSAPNIPRPPPRKEVVRQRAKTGGGSTRRTLSWLVALGVGIAAGALSYEWLEPVTQVFNDLVSRAP